MWEIKLSNNEAGAKSSVDVTHLSYLVANQVNPVPLPRLFTAARDTDTNRLTLITCFQTIGSHKGKAAAWELSPLEITARRKMDGMWFSRRCRQSETMPECQSGLEPPVSFDINLSDITIYCRWPAAPHGANFTA